MLIGIIFLIINIVFLIISIVKISKKTKSKVYGIISLIVTLLSPFILCSVLSAYITISPPGESGNGNIYAVIPIGLALLTSIANIVLSCIILPKGNNNMQTINSNNSEPKTNSKNLENNNVNNDVENIEETDEQTVFSDDECSEIYKHSARRKIEIAGRVCGIISVVMLVVCLICSFCGLATIMIPFYIIGFICGGVWIWSVFAKRRFCSRCGCAGEEVSCEQTGQSTKVERKLVTQNHERQSSNGHISVDKDGNEYVEQLVTTTTYKITMMCPNCKHIWTYSQKKKS